MNIVTLKGNFTADPEMRYTPSGKAVCTVNIAVNNSFKDKQTGEWRDNPAFIRVEAWDKLAERMKDYIKGTTVVVSGRLAQDNWTDKTTNAKRSALKISADQLFKVDKANNQSGSAEPPADETAPY